MVTLAAESLRQGLASATAAQLSALVAAQLQFLTDRMLPWPVCTEYLMYASYCYAFMCINYFNLQNNPIK